MGVKQKQKQKQNKKKKEQKPTQKYSDDWLYFDWTMLELKWSNACFFIYLGRYLLSPSLKVCIWVLDKRFLTVIAHGCKKADGQINTIGELGSNTGNGCQITFLLTIVIDIIPLLSNSYSSFFYHNSFDLSILRQQVRLIWMVAGIRNINND